MTIQGNFAGLPRLRAGIAVLAVLAGCASSPAAAQLNIAAEARVTLLARAYNATGQQLFAQFAAAPSNIVFSPYSIGTALSMALTGARGDTATEIMRAMALRMNNDALDTANAEMLAILNGYDHSATPLSCPPRATLNGRNCEMRPLGEMKQCQFGLSLAGDRCSGPAAAAPSARLLAANALMLLARGDAISDSYAATLRSRYAAEVFKDAGLDDINGWVARKTEGKIDRILDAVDPDFAAVLLNAVYFKARWAQVFDPKLSKDDAFHLTRSSDATVPLMNQTGGFSLVSRGGYRAVRLNYEIPELALVIVLPDEIEGAAAVARRLGPNELAELFAALRDGQARKPVALTLPRFKAAFKADLVLPLRQAGMRKAFDPKAADFSGMTGVPAGERRLSISAIMHRAVIDVAEESTEAAAATAVTIRAMAAPVATPAPVAFRVDHPFLFYLVEDSSGAILFQGRIADPR